MSDTPIPVMPTPRADAVEFEWTPDDVTFMPIRAFRAAIHLARSLERELAEEIRRNRELLSILADSNERVNAIKRIVHCGTFDHEGRCGACAKKISELKHGNATCPLGQYPQWPWPEEDKRIRKSK